MDRAQTRVHRSLTATGPLSQCRTAVSLHSHTNHSKETLDFLPRYIDFHRIPILSRLLRAEINRRQRNGNKVDFSRAYWTPPVTARMVLESEKLQIDQKLGLAAMVSITDHDTIAAPLSLQQEAQTDWVPVSVEWTVPFRGNAFHFGVHNLPSARAVDVMATLSDYTANPSEETLADLFAFFDSSPDTLIVLNHPCCNFVRVPAEQHWATLRQLMAKLRSWIHATEVNGMRPWNENQDALRLADEYDLPVVAGGDRHGCRPNAMLNLTAAETWDEFVSHVRTDHRNDVLLLPAYTEPVRLRELATAADVLRRYPRHPYGQRRFTDRIFANVEGYSWHPLSFYWDGGDSVPVWLAPIVTSVIALGSDPVRPVLRRLLSLSGPDYGSEAASTLEETKFEARSPLDQRPVQDQ